LESDKSANHLPHYCDRSGGGRDWVYGAKHNMRSHPNRQVRQRPECCKIDRLEGGSVCLDDRQFVVAIDGGSAVTRQVLYHGEYSSCQQSVRNRFRDCCNFLLLSAVSAITYNRIAVC